MHAVCGIQWPIIATGGGGSLHAPNEIPLAAGGAGAVLAGLMVTGYALRRRRGVTC